MPSPSSKAPPSSPPPAPSSTDPPTSLTSTPNEDPTRFPPSEETLLLNESNDLKTRANTTFTAGDYLTAISEYDKALASCPNYLDYEIAVLKSNVAACHLKLEDWKAAVESADQALEGIERLLRPISKTKNEEEDRDGDDDDDDDATHPPKPNSKNPIPHNHPNTTTEDQDTTIVELDPSISESAALAVLQQRDARSQSIARIKCKSLMRRARAKTSIGGWANLQAAQDDYSTLNSMPADVLPPQDKKVVTTALRELPARVTRAREEEMGEMMGKLKELGNTVLKPFGLSTDMFKMQKDEKTGGYSMSINQEN